MKTRIHAPRAGLGLAALALGMVVAVAAAALVAPAVAADASEVPMCNGRKDANLVLTAHTNGKPSGVPKFILNVSTDAAATPTGSLIFDQGADHLVVTDFCRVWQHLPGTEPRCDTEDDPEGATTAHAVGTTTLNGVPVVVRADVRETADGKVFRLRYRPLGEHDEATAAEEGGDECEGGWTWYPAEEGWAPLGQFRLRVTG